MSEESTSLVLVEAKFDLVPVKVFTKEGTDDVLAKLKTHARSLAQNPEYDISTPLGRKNRASLAYDVSKSKVFLEKLGDGLVEGWRKQTKAVTVEKTRIEKELAELRDEIRQPLTDWEEAEKNRAQAHEDSLALMAQLDTWLFEPNVAAVQEMISALPRHYERDWEEFKPRAELIHSNMEKALAARLALVTKQEADAAELARLRAEEEARVAAWHVLFNEARDDNIAFSAAAQDKKDAEDKAEKDRVAEATRAAAELKKAQDEKDEAERKRVKAEQDKKDSEARAEKDRLKALQDKKDAEDAAAKRERDKIAKEQAEEAKAAAAREADIKHKKKINNEALEAIVKVLNTAIAPQDQARALIIALAKSEIPHVSIKY